MHLATAFFALFGGLLLGVAVIEPAAPQGFAIIGSVTAMVALACAIWVGPQRE